MAAMRIQILGTAAAEGWPGLFCGCKTCALARERGGKDFRSRASLQIDDIYKIDFPPDSYYHSTRFGIDFSKLKYLFFTHSHEDHFAPKELEYLREGFAFNIANAPLRVYGPPAVYSALNPLLSAHPDLPMSLNHAVPFEPIEADHLIFTPIIASHAQGQLCLNYIVQSGATTMLYTCDSGLYGDDTMRFLAEFRFDALIVECTFGPTKHESRVHMSLDGVLKFRKNLMKAHALADGARWIATHISHCAGMLHEEMEPIFARHGIELAYDGMQVEL